MSGAFEFILAGMLVGYHVVLQEVGVWIINDTNFSCLLGLNRISQLVLIYFTPRSLDPVDRWFAHAKNLISSGRLFYG